MTQHRPTSFIDASSIGGSSGDPVVVFAATRWELAAIRRAMPVAQRVTIDGMSCYGGRQAGRAYWLVCTGIGTKAADAAANVLLSRGAALAVSAGFAGALIPRAAVGDVVLATSVVAGTFDGRWRETESAIVCEETAVRAAQGAAADIGGAVHIGPIVSLARVLCRAIEKDQLSRLAGAIALDMESAAIGKVARRHGIPFAVIRTISDAAHEDLPLDFNAFLEPWGWIRGFGAILSAPSTLIGLNRLRRQSGRAAARLTAVTARWAAHGFGLAPVSQPGRA